MRNRQKFRLDWGDEEEDDDEYYDDEDEDGQCSGETVEGPSYAPIFTGILKADGSPLIRHPIVIRMGFHKEENKFYCPTLEEGKFGETGGKVFGWVYE